MTRAEQLAAFVVRASYDALGRWHDHPQVMRQPLDGCTSHPRLPASAWKVG
jgi:hypothetical protein